MADITLLQPPAAHPVRKNATIAPARALDALLRAKLNPYLAAEREDVDVDEFLLRVPKDEGARAQIEAAMQFYGLLESFDTVKTLISGLAEILTTAEPGDYVKGLSAATNALAHFSSKTNATSAAGGGVTVNIVDGLLASIDPALRPAAMTLFRPPKGALNGRSRAVPSPDEEEETSG